MEKIIERMKNDNLTEKIATGEVNDIPILVRKYSTEDKWVLEIIVNEVNMPLTQTKEEYEKNIERIFQEQIEKYNLELKYNSK